MHAGQIYVYRPSYTQHGSAHVEWIVVNELNELMSYLINRLFAGLYRPIYRPPGLYIMAIVVNCILHVHDCA